MSRDNHRDADWLSSATTVAPVVGVLAYGVSYVTLSRFYTELGATPDDVGLGYRSVLSRSFGFLVLVGIVGSVVVIAIPPLWRRLPQRHRRAGARLRSIVVLVAVVTGLAIGNSLLGHAIDVRWKAALAGHRVSPVSLFGLTLISIHADPARLSRPVSPGSGRDVLYLGSANGIAVVFDPRIQRTLYVSLTDTAVEIEPIHPAPENPGR